MAKYKFRGKNLKGSWVNGYLMGDKYIGSFDPKKPQYEEVVPETIGLCTGYMAHNGIVYEGDIVQYVTEWDDTDHLFTELVVFEEGAFLAGECGRELADCEQLTIVGNKTDNPDMKYGYYKDVRQE